MLGEATADRSSQQLHATITRYNMPTLFNATCSQPFYYNHLQQVYNVQAGPTPYTNSTVFYSNCHVTVPLQVARLWAAQEEDGVF